MKLADIAYEAGNTEEALHLYNRALEIQPKNSHAWVRKALCTAGETRANEIRARVKETVAYLNKARESDSPQLKEIEEAQDKIRDDMARFANVMTAKSSESAQQLWSGDYLGGGPMYQQGMKEALSYCSIALEVDPENVQALENRMFVLKKLGWLSNRTEIKEIQAKVARIKSARP